MFTEKSFEVFQVAGLEERMAVIRQEIQPVFQEIGDQAILQLNKNLQRPFYLHIAQHRRRTVHAPENTWAAISEGKRGYKMAPHFQIGIWSDHVFMWLSLIDQPKGQQAMAEKMLDNLSLFEKLAKDTVINLDHTKPDRLPFSEESLQSALTRLAKVKSAEFQIGRVIAKDSPLWQTPEKALDYMLATYQKLLPIYELIYGEA